MSTLPIDLVSEILGRRKRYSEFRCLNKSTNTTTISWDGWDALIEQGITANISREVIWWCKNGQLHRDGDLPAVETSEGYKSWYKNGQLYRTDQGVFTRIVEFVGTRKLIFLNIALWSLNIIQAIKWYRRIFKQ